MRAGRRITEPQLIRHVAEGGCMAVPRGTRDAGESSMVMRSGTYGDQRPADTFDDLATVTDGGDTIWMTRGRI